MVRFSHMTRSFAALIRSLLIFISLTLAAGGQSLPPGDGQDIVQHQCAGCHALKVVTSKKASKQQWSTIVDQMVSRGADVADEDIETVVQYLAKNFGPAPDPPAKDSDRTTVNANKATAKEIAVAIGLSAKESEAIVHYREQNGDFKSWHDLTNVPGVDTKKIELNKDKITF